MRPPGAAAPCADPLTDREIPVMIDPPPRTPRIIAPPPLIYLAAFALGGLAQRITPVQLISSQPGTVMGLPILLLSAVLAFRSFATLRRLGTPVSPYRPTRALATTGPYGYSRNPIYLALTGLYLGAAFVWGSVWPFVTVAPALLLVHRGVIFREESYLAEIFGEDFNSYRRRVGRWL